MSNAEGMIVLDTFCLNTEIRVLSFNYLALQRKPDLSLGARLGSLEAGYSREEIRGRVCQQVDDQPGGVGRHRAQAPRRQKTRSSLVGGLVRHGSS